MGQRGHLQLAQLGPVRRRVDPLRIGREQHLYTVTKLVGNKGCIHVRDQTHRCVGVPAAVLTATANTEFGAGEENGERVGIDL